MNDMSQVIVPRSDQINADDLLSEPMTVTIRGVAITAGTEQPVSIDIGIPGKVYRPCKSMSRVLVAAWGADAKKYVGRSVTLYRDPNVKWGGLAVGGIRISHLSDIDRDMTMALTETRASRKPYTVKPLASASAPKPPSTDKPQTPTEYAAHVRARFDACQAAHDFAALSTWWATPATKRWIDRVRDNDAALADALDAEFEAVRDRLGGGE